MLKKSLLVLVSGLVLSSAVYAANAPTPAPAPNPACPYYDTCYQNPDSPNYGLGPGYGLRQGPGQGYGMYHRGSGMHRGAVMHRGAFHAQAGYHGFGHRGLNRAHMSNLMYQVKNNPEFQKEVAQVISLQDRVFVARQELDVLKTTSKDLHLIKDKSLALSKLKRQLQFANAELIDKVYAYYHTAPMSTPAKPLPKAPAPAPAGK